MKQIINTKLQESKKDHEELEKIKKSTSIKPTEEELFYKDEIIKSLSEKFSKEFSLKKNQHERRALDEKINHEINKELDKYPELDAKQRSRIHSITLANIRGLGPIEKFMQDEEITEVVVQKYDKINIEKKGIVYKTDARFTDERHLINTINRIVSRNNRVINLNNPMVDARLSDGSRVNATVPPITPDGATLTIRKFSKSMLSPLDYVKSRSIAKLMVLFLKYCVKSKKTIMISGGTGSGKTTLLNMLSSFIPEDELIVTIESSLELQLQQPNVRRMEERRIDGNDHADITARKLFVNALRMRPDRIIVGEIRDEVIIDFMAAASSGHDGTLCTVHANSPLGFIDVRAPILYNMDKKVNFDINTQKLQISEALNIIVQIERLKFGKNKGKRKVVDISIIEGIDNNFNIKLNKIYGYDYKQDEFYCTGYVPENLLQDFIWTCNPDINRDIFRKGVIQ